MKTRLHAIMEWYGLNAKQFSEKVSINGSSLSYMLKGRNLPSYDALQKIIESFPEINIEWLMTGNGPMLKDGSSPISSPTSNEEPSLFDQVFGSAAPEHRPIAENRLIETQTDRLPVYEEEKAVKLPLKTEENPHIQEVTPSKKCIGEMCVPERIAVSKAGIQKIVVFYTDHSYEEFVSSR